jgi:hypothetical protein
MQSLLSDQRFKSEPERMSRLKGKKYDLHDAPRRGYQRAKRKWSVEIFLPELRTKRSEEKVFTSVEGRLIIRVSG